MAVAAFCPGCKRKVYVADGDTPICPVCASPLLETVPPPPDRGDDDSGG